MTSKRSIVMSGGGVKGAHSVGLLAHLLGDLQINYSGYYGVSVGAINCAFLAQFPTGQEKEASDQLVKMWLELDTYKIYHNWWFFGKWAALWKTSLFDSSPMQKLIRDNISLDKIRSSGKSVSVGAVNLNSGKYTIFDQTSDHFVDAVIASASFPTLLTPVHFDGHLFSDGGIKTISPIKTAIDHGADEIDVIMTSPETRIKYYIENPKTIDIMKRAIDLSTDKIMSNDIEKIKIYNLLADANLTDKKKIKINIFSPQFNLTDDFLDFNPEKIKKMMDLGYVDAQRIMGNNKA